MTWQDMALGVAGIIGCGVSVVHGLIVQRIMVKPFDELLFVDRRILPSVRRLSPPLLQFSTFNWFIGGLALIAVAIGAERNVQIATGLLVGSSYLFGAACNLWATRGLHPGWILYTVALVLIAFGLTPSGG